VKDLLLSGAPALAFASIVEVLTHEMTMPVAILLVTPFGAGIVTIYAKKCVEAAPACTTYASRLGRLPRLPRFEDGINLLRRRVCFEGETNGLVQRAFCLLLIVDYPKVSRGQRLLRPKCSVGDVFGEAKGDELVKSTVKLLVVRPLLCFLLLLQFESIIAVALRLWLLLGNGLSLTRATNATSEGIDCCLGPGDHWRHEACNHPRALALTKLGVMLL
jgi:hypothetical protein